jgi:hypothetical protein
MVEPIRTMSASVAAKPVRMKIVSGTKRRH